jgi:hypothetical protein
MSAGGEEPLGHGAADETGAMVMNARRISPKLSHSASLARTFHPVQRFKMTL